MSIFETLLDDAPSAPVQLPLSFEVWIALRSDGLPGTGTQSDPLNGSSIPYPAVAVATLSYATITTPPPTFYEATVFAPSHGLLEGQMVTISGVKLISASTRQDQWYAGTFQIYEVTSSTFKYTMVAQPYSSVAPAEPGGIQCWLEREQFDVAMRKTGPNQTIRLGPGVFETKGYGLAGLPTPKGQTSVLQVGSWQIKTAQRILGSGIEVTTLKLVGASFPEILYEAISHEYQHILDSAEISDFTIDCNIAGQPNQQVACAACSLSGKHIRIRRIRAINFSSQTLTYFENFVIAIFVVHPNVSLTDPGEDSVIEDCIAERPGANPINNNTILHIGGDEERPSDGFNAYSRAFGIRNSYVNGQFIYGTLIPLPIDTINYDPVSAVVTVTSKYPHRLAKPGNCLLQGVTINNGNSDNVFNGLFEVSQVLSDKMFTYNLHTTEAPDSNNGMVGGGVSSSQVAIKQIDPDDTLDVCPFLALHSFEQYENRFKITTLEPHFRTPNNKVRVSGVQHTIPDPKNPGKFIDVETTAFTGRSYPVGAILNSSFPVDPDRHDPMKPLELYYILDVEPDVPNTKLITYGSAFVHMFHVALSADGGTAVFAEGHRVYHCHIGGPYHDTFPSLDVVVRNNYYHDVLTGPFQNFNGSISQAPVPIPFDKTLGLSHSDSTAVATTTLPHGFRIGDFVIITNAAGADAAFYNGNPKVQISAVPTATSFNYLMPGIPAGDAHGVDANNPVGFSTYESLQQPIFGTILNVIVTYQARLASLTRIQRGSRFYASAVMYPVTTSFAHGLKVGDPIRVNKAGRYGDALDGGFPDPTEVAYNGIFRVTAVPDLVTFEYEILDANGKPKDPGPGSSGPSDTAFSAGYFGRIWQVRRLIIEDNVIELGLRSTIAGYGTATAFPMYGYSLFPPEYSLRDIIIRGNVVRSVEGPSTNLPSLALDIGACERFLFENNIISLDNPSPLKHRNMGTIKTFNNTKPDGTLITSNDANPPYGAAPEVVIQIQNALDDAMASSFLNL